MLTAFPKLGANKVDFVPHGGVLSAPPVFILGGLKALILGIFCFRVIEGSSQLRWNGDLEDKLNPHWNTLPWTENYPSKYSNRPQQQNRQFY